MARAVLDLTYDYFCAPCIGRWYDELVNVKSCMIVDFEYIRKHRRVLRQRPEKGVVRLALIAWWIVMHLYALIVFAVYGAFNENTVQHSTWWFVTTGFAGAMYVLLVYSDPGFIDREMLQRMVAPLNLGVEVVGSDRGRGLITDVEAQLPSMVEMLPAAAQPLSPADEEETDEATSASASSSLAPTESDPAVPAESDAVELAAAMASATMGSPSAIATAAEQVHSGGGEGGHGEPASVDDVGVEMVSRSRDGVEMAAAGGGEGGRAPSGKGKARAKIEPTSQVPNLATSQVPELSNVGEAGPSHAGFGAGIGAGIGGGGGEMEEIDDEELKYRLARKPRIVGYDEEGMAEAAAELAKRKEERAKAPPGLFDYFSGYCDEADMCLP